VLLISDIHANWTALEAVLAHAAGRYETLWFLGDLLDTGPNPLDCVRFVKTQLTPDQWRVGNHDLGVMDRLPDAEWGRDATYTLPRHRQILQAEESLWSWYEAEVQLHRGGPMRKVNGTSEQVLTHANLDNDMGPHGYLFPGDPWVTRRNLFNLRQHLSTPEQNGWLLAGHTHIPCLFHLAAEADDAMSARAQSIHWGDPVSLADGYYYINPGSVGQPRDGNPDACYVILDLATHTVTWHRVAYNVEAVVDQMNYFYQGRALKPTRETLISMLRNGGSAKTESRMMPVYRKEAHGLIVG
jgi:predicted phosphodiesterase